MLTRGQGRPGAPSKGATAQCHHVECAGCTKLAPRARRDSVGMVCGVCLRMFASSQAGTNSGNPLSVVAGLKTLDILERDGVHQRLETLGARFEAGLVAALEATGVKGCVQRVGSMITLFFGPGPIRNLADATACDTKAFGRFHAAMLARGLYLPPSAFEAWFLSNAHDEDDVDCAVAAAAEALPEALG